MAVTKNLNDRGLSTLVVVLILFVIAGLAVGGWYVWQNQKSSESDAATTNKVASPDNTQLGKSNDPTEGGKYLVIKEWGVRAPLPTDAYGSVTYTLSEVSPDPDGNQLQAAKILVTKSSMAENGCGTTETQLGVAIDAGAQYIRSEHDKPFNALRYKRVFEEDILSDKQYDYHLNYVNPDCVGSNNSIKLEALYKTLGKLEEVR